MAVCTQPDHPVKIVRAAAPAYPASAQRLNLGEVSAIIDVTVDASGKVTNVSIIKSSSNADIDQAALRAARASAYAPAQTNCTAFGGTYAFTAQFRSNAHLVPPAFTAPAGWTAVKAPPPAGPQQVFFVYVSVPRTIAVDALLDPFDTPEAVRARFNGGLAHDPHVTNKNERATHMCNGSQNGWLLSYDVNDTKGETSVAIVYGMVNNVVYRATYRAPAQMPPDASVLAALKSMCLPAK